MTFAGASRSPFTRSIDYKQLIKECSKSAGQATFILLVAGDFATHSQPSKSEPRPLATRSRQQIRDGGA